MNGKKRNLITDTEAVSGAIGAVLLIAIFVTLYTMLQATAVPMWNKQVEAVEIRVTYDDMMFLPSDIEDVAMHGTPKTCTVQLGAQYPDRMIFRNPGLGAYGTLAVEEVPAWVNVTYYYNDSTHEEHFNSTRITYEMSGTINSPKIVYEHGVIIADWETGNVTTDEQTLIDRNENLYIPIVNGSSHSKSAIGSETMVIYPYLYNDTINASWVNVTLDTEYPELWKDTLFNVSTVLPDLHLQNTDVRFVDNTIYINTNQTAPRYLKYHNQTASGPLYAGLISYTVEDPDGGSTGDGDGDGDGDGGGYNNGTGQSEVASGNLWWNIPSSSNITKLEITAIAYDPSGGADLKNDAIRIIVKDDDGDWWKVVVDFDTGSSAIDKLTATSKAAGTTQSECDYDPDLDVDSPSTYPIDLLNADYVDDSACYQYANIDDTNTLVTYLDSGANEKSTALLFYELDIDD